MHNSSLKTASPGIIKHYKYVQLMKYAQYLASGNTIISLFLNHHEALQYLTHLIHLL